jgi:hypothetical protein
VLFDCCAIAGTVSPIVRIGVIKNDCTLISFLPSVSADIFSLAHTITYPGPRLCEMGHNGATGRLPLPPPLPNRRVPLV